MAGDPITMRADSPSGHTGTLGGTGSLLTLVTPPMFPICPEYVT